MNADKTFCILKARCGNRTIEVFKDQASVSEAAGLGPIAAVPVPASIWLFASGLLGLVGFARTKRKVGS